ncbi:MAG: MFS transporter [Selenomonadaceae bacterium]|nr:MFS transporter [Selenomonadaceae bacterium]
MENKIWTRDFVLNSLICFIANLSYYMTMVIITDYMVEKIGVSLSEAGFACGVFILGALFARLFIGQSIEVVGMKKALYLGMILFISTALNFVTYSLWSISFVRFVQGIGFGIALTLTGAIMAQIVPSSRRGEGTSYYAMFVTTATAIGPFAGIYFYQAGDLTINLII